MPKIEHKPLLDYDFEDLDVHINSDYVLENRLRTSKKLSWALLWIVKTYDITKKNRFLIKDLADVMHCQQNQARDYIETLKKYSILRLSPYTEGKAKIYTLNVDNSRHLKFIKTAKTILGLK